MGRENAKRATIQDLISRKMQRDADLLKTVEVYVPSMDATLTLQKPPDDLLFDTIDEMGEGRTRDIMVAMKHLIYQICPTLQDPELHKELGVVDPFDTMNVLFDLADIGAMSDQVTDLFGLASLEEKTKN